MESLTKDDKFILIGQKPRAERKGGNFEVYKINRRQYKKDEVTQVVNDLIKTKKFYFIVAGRESLKEQILQNSPIDAEKFSSQEYLILEKNTLRLVNSDEKGIIKEATRQAQSRSTEVQSASTADNSSDIGVAVARSLPSESSEGDVNKLTSELKKLTTNEDTDQPLSDETISDLMKISYGRMAMANYRGRCRYHRLVGEYYKTFNFARRRHSIKIQMYGNEALPTPAHTYYDVTLTDYGKTLALKKVFEILQVYNSQPSEFTNDSEQISYIDGSMPLLLDLHIGGTDYKFLLSQSVYDSRKGYQVQISMLNPHDDYVGNAYPYWIGDEVSYGFSKGSQNEQSVIAKCCLECLNSTMSNQGEKLKNIKENDAKKIIEFLATTQIAEANHGNRDYDRARTVGMNKLARSLLRSIEENNLTFRKTFDPYSFGGNSYPPIGDGGTERARHAVCSVTRVGARCDDMSDDSDSEDGEYEFTLFIDEHDHVGQSIFQI
ncbi:unnamed protein product [Rotaria socialis]|uniref:Uncharacterized protein n=1 Tax=Rotaria socialis TaxID=392032 RepID=A0A817VNG3_9BILA|nr:unnamed protein product [Rotaria socialis]CAF4562176.1 unnamed protein product [Rotaria socialis]